MLENSLSFRIRLRREERKGGDKIRTVRSLVGHGIPFGWVASPMKSRDAVYLSPTDKSSEKFAASGMCLGLKDPADTTIRSITVSYAFPWHVAERKKKKDERKVWVSQGPLGKAPLRCRFLGC